MPCARRTWLLVSLGLALRLAAAAALADDGTAGGGWPEHGGDKAASLYSPLDQINGDNVRNLDIVWRWRSLDEELREKNEELRKFNYRIYHYEVTPLKIGDKLYVSTSLGLVAALDPKNGETLWSYDPEAHAVGQVTNLGYLTRGVAYWTDGRDERLLHAPSDATLISIDPKTHRPDPNFGDNGKVDLKQGLGRPADHRAYSINSPPIVCRDVVIVGSAIRDTPVRREIPPGHVRGYDVHTGKLLWIFHTIPQEGELGNDTWEEDSWREAGSTNVWAPMSADEELGYVYLPVGQPSHNWYGGHRLGGNLFSNSVVCVECKTGKRVWHYQLLHHSVWDYDPPAAPNLIDITVDGKTIKAVAQLTKQGLLFTFDRVTGEPVWPIKERPVPQTDVPGERTSPTQPFPTKPPPFELIGASEEDLIDLTPELRAEALENFNKYRTGPLYTPPSEKGTIVNPGWAGGGNWNGAAFDPDTQILYIPSYSDYNLIKLVKPDPARSNFDYIWGGITVPKVQENLSLFKPPYGRITAIDMKRGEHVWQVANGDGPRQHPALKDLDLPPLGRGFSGGESFILLTKTLLFATTDRDEWNPPMMRAFDKATGEVVWEKELPARVHATPMTYMANGKQYIVVALGGGRYGAAAEQEPDELVALSLP